ncbi:RIP metalloprotease RseP [Kiloniella laminariae]|uniref:Zinc metalloprotease n=1 Tax=Kiloniella laminariae TaxID=454162 RepID=A0ABT4LLT5_9PROT|nr:RIP metalloprotease RseP [Kiloniella laminariae]MCZ4282029.1 RIP metalloprotease RseP [Kiloniella laminariae]
MDLITTTLSFLVLLTILVFFHELGHYWVARKAGVKVNVFSVGFGPELFGYTDKNQTRWKFSLVPLGGYVKMFGDSDVSSSTHKTGNLSEEEYLTTFKAKSVAQRSAIVAAGPIANFVLAIVLLAGLFIFVGQPYSVPRVAKVMEDSAAKKAGFLVDDLVIEADGQSVLRFEDLQRIVQLGTGEAITVLVERDLQVVALSVTPKVDVSFDDRGNEVKRLLLGIQSKGSSYKKHDPWTAVVQAGVETYDLSIGTFKAIGQIFQGQRSVDELGGPVRIAHMSGQAAEAGWATYVWLMAVLSINLGLLNLMPIPMLDGGHLLFYSLEAALGRPISDRTQEYCFRIGLALVLSLMLFVTWNDVGYFQLF